jgi:hypothetical protein
MVRTCTCATASRIHIVRVCAKLYANYVVARNSPKTVADEPLDFAEPDAGRREAVALVVGDHLHAVAGVSPHGHARVSRPEVDTYRRSVSLGRRHLQSSKTGK